MLFPSEFWQAQEGPWKARRASIMIAHVCYHSWASKRGKFRIW